MKVRFPLIGRIEEVEEGTTVAAACALAGIHLDLVCGGNGTCGKCTVDVAENGQVHSVLSCKYPVSPDMEILVENKAAEAQLLATSITGVTGLDTLVKRVIVPAESIKADMGSFAHTALSKAMNIPLAPLSFKMVQKLSQARFWDVESIAVVLYYNQVIDFAPVDESEKFLGIAVDIGTTSVVVFMFDIATGALLGRRSAPNAQQRFGADVISRIEHTEQDAANLALEQQAICETITQMLDELLASIGAARKDVYEAVYCGNSTMQHLFLGISPAPLGRKPFTGVVSETVVAAGDALPVPINPNGRHVFMPLLGGFVGADTTAALLELPDDDNLRMMLDLGTNCEVAVGNDEHMLVASTACGPALEGAGLTCGMRAVKGAVERVSYVDGKLDLATIGDADPLGFCGSGVIDAVAALLESGILTGRGRFLTGSKAAAHPLGDRIVTDEEGARRFVFLSAEENPAGVELCMTMKDIRAIQSAKSAIYTGCALLLEEYGADPRELEEICLAGAFGSYLDIEHAQAIGMVPKIEGVPVRSIGNGAGLGAQRCLLSVDSLLQAEVIRRHTTHVELAECAGFSQTYLESMSFEVNFMESAMLTRQSA